MIHIVTDSSCDIPHHLLQKYNIHVVPLTIRVNGKEYVEGIDITSQEFYQEMMNSDELPQTSQPTPAKFAQKYDELAGNGEVLCLTISSKLSGTFDSANLGQKLSSNLHVTVFDTLGASLGQGLQVLKAAEYALAGLSMEEIIIKMTKMRDEMKFLLLLDTLENIVKGGRVSRFQGGLAKLLDIKVILHNVEGSIEILEKVRGHAKSMQRLIELVGERKEDLSDCVIGISHVNNLSDTQKLAAELERRYHPKEILIQETGATISTHAGKAGIIVAF